MSLEFIEPQLATSVGHPPPRGGWIHEIKHDGYRTLLIIERRKARAYTRNGFDWSKRYAPVGDELSSARDRERIRPPLIAELDVPPANSNNIR
jgi:bifunctional non-homologous end joining protein LigD